MHADLTLLADLGLIFSVAVAIAILLGRIGLPPVLAYLGTGLLLGPEGLGLVARGGALDLIAEIGVVLLLFTVGLEFSLDELKRSWRAVLLAGGLQVGGTVGLAAIVGSLVGIPLASAITWGFLASLSSTAVVLRLLDARGETKAAPGRLIVGVLIFQDLCVVPMMLVLPVLAGEGGGALSIAWVLAKAVGIVAAILVGARVAVPRLMQAVARTRNREVFLLAVLAIAGITAYATSLTGLSLALGAFVAGMILADTQYAHQALADVLPMRAVMMCVFFVTIGMLIDLEAVAAHPWVVTGLFAGIVAGKFAVMTFAALALRFPLRVAALAGAAVAQVGEFSFVLANAASGHGLISEESQRVFLAASVLTIAVAPVLLAAFPRVRAGSRALAPIERVLGGADAPDAIADDDPLVDHVVVAGLGVGGRAVVDALERARITPVIVELNPETVTRERARGRRVVYGDVTSPEVLEHAGIARARALVLVVSDFEASKRASEVARGLRADLPIVMRTRFASEEGAERAHGVDVLSEEFAGAMSIAGLVLRRCGVTNWSTHVGVMVVEHEALPADAEGALGRPPSSAAAVALVRARATAPTAPRRAPPESRPAVDASPFQRWTVALLTSTVAGSCMTAMNAAFSVQAFALFVGAVAVSAAYGGLLPGLFTAVAGWVFSNVLFLDPIGELSFHPQAIGLLIAYAGAAMVGGLVRARTPAIA
jgi:CPA2 family monovalent cation:H+ antiporter-2